MQEPSHHLLDSLYPNNSLLLLEAMIPYVEPSLKLPLALLIKMQEIQFLMQVFNNPSRMEACGLNRSNNGSEEMFRVLCQTMGVDIMGQMKQMQQMQNMMSAMNAMNTMNTMNSTNEQEINTMKEEETRNDMIDAIRQILSEQEESPNESEPIT